MIRERTRKGEMVVGGRRKKVSSSEGDCTRDVDRPRCQKKTEKGIRGKRMNREEVGWRASFITKGIDIFLDDYPPRVFI